MNVDVCSQSNSMECIRCGDCLAVCKSNAISKVHVNNHLKHFDKEFKSDIIDKIPE
jgi:ferredoxin